MKRFRDWSVLNKLLSFFVASSAVALIFAISGIVTFDLITFRRAMVDDLVTIAKIIGNQSIAALEFNDRDTTQEILTSHEMNESVTSSYLYDEKGDVHAMYHREKIDLLEHQVPKVEPTGHRFDNEGLIIFQEISYFGNKVGTVMIRSDMRQFRERIKKFTLVTGVIFLCAIIVSIIISVNLRTTLFRPIFQLIKTSREIAETRNYSLRAFKWGDDEIGDLVAEFNDMLEQIEVRSFELQLHRESLEMEVDLRTSELQEQNEELKIAKESAEAASRAKSSFLANMSHELRTPLNAIIGYSEILMEESEDFGDEVQEIFIPDLDRIRVAGKHLVNLIQDVLDISKIEAGKMDFYIEDVDVQALVDDIATTMRSTIEKNNNSFTVDLPGEINIIRTDLTKIRQMLFNLLSNAGKFTENGAVELTVRKEEIDRENWITFRIRDTGVGMTEEEIGKVFKAFTQADVSTTRKFGGTGLGLAITKRFVTALEGRIDVESERGIGSTFKLWMPLKSTISQTPLTTRAIEDGVHTGRGSVLVIDDDPDARNLISRFVQREGYQTETAESGETGLQLARTLQPDVITLDVMMPGMDGWMVLSALKTDPALADIPVIMITMVDDKQTGFTLGVSDYLIKPVNRDMLRKLLEKHRPKRSGSGVVLVVEDDVETRTIIRHTLTSDDWEVREAENGRVALEAVIDQKPDIVLLDLMMPEVDGFQFLEAFRLQEDWRSIPVIVVTAKELTNEDRRQLEGNVKSILKKGSYTRDRLLSEIVRFVESNVTEE